MATGATIIDGALRKLGQIEAGETPTTDEYADALEALNDILDSLNNERLVCFALQTETLTLVNGDNSYTVGTSGDLNTTRPVEIVSAYVVSGYISYPVEIISEEEYAEIPDKTTTADWPTHMVYRPTIASSLGNVVVYPTPNGTATLKLVTRVVLSSVATTATTVTLPPGWNRYLTNQLAIEIAPEYETTPSPSVLKAASEALAGIKKANLLTRQKVAYTGLGAVFSPYAHNIESDS